MLKRKSTIISLLVILLLAAIAFAVLNDSATHAPEATDRLPTVTGNGTHLPPVRQNPLQQSNRSNIPAFNSAPPQTPANRTPQFSRNHQNQSSAVAKDVMMLQRATYQLPADAAETLKKLFDHQDTSLVECRIDRTEGDDSMLVSLVVTAAVPTQQAIGRFVESVFPAKRPQTNLQPSLPGETDQAQASIKPKIVRTVSVKLPKMACDACRREVTTYLKQVDGVSNIEESDKQDRFLLAFQCEPGTDVKELLIQAANSNRFFEDYKLVSIEKTVVR